LNDQLNEKHSTTLGLKLIRRDEWSRNVIIL